MCHEKYEAGDQPGYHACMDRIHSCRKQVSEEAKRATAHNNALAKCKSAEKKNKPPTDTSKPDNQGTSDETDLSERIKAAKKSAVGSAVKTKQQLEELKRGHEQSIREAKQKYEQEQAEAKAAQEAAAERLREEQRRLEEAEEQQDQYDEQQNSSGEGPADCSQCPWATNRCYRSMGRLMCM
jgi:hypothetical protein